MFPRGSASCQTDLSARPDQTLEVRDLGHRGSAASSQCASPYNPFDSPVSAPSPGDHMFRIEPATPQFLKAASALGALDAMSPIPAASPAGRMPVRNTGPSGSASKWADSSSPYGRQQSSPRSPSQGKMPAPPSFSPSAGVYPTAGSGGGSPKVGKIDNILGQILRRPVSAGRPVTPSSTAADGYLHVPNSSRRRRRDLAISSPAPRLGLPRTLDATPGLARSLHATPQSHPRMRSPRPKSAVLSLSYQDQPKGERSIADMRRQLEEWRGDLSQRMLNTTI